MTKIPHLPIKRFPTFEIYARFSPGTLDTITYIRNKYTTKPIYPRDIGICLFKGITKNDVTTKALSDALTTIASSVAPFKVEFLKPFRNKSAEIRKYPASVYYEINNSPFNLLCADFRMFFKKQPSRKFGSPETNRSFKIGITGEVESYEESDKIVKEIREIEKPKPLSFDAFVLASRPNHKLLSELDDEIQEYPFTADEETFKNYIQNITAKRDEHVKRRHEERDRDKKMLK
ncbi:putative blumeria specific protein [Erysiphe neolycopersici]|uniref:Putative blumeria specific protein n=1 Tax=Erysiphe neolycopersici TaxID=212602 RepID=A0A420H758_9PEZI|nr:putative blumeria specific protein [Erysiphe neolycopersici]